MSFMARHQWCKPVQPLPTASPVGDELRPVAGMGMQKVLPCLFADTMLLVHHPLFRSQLDFCTKKFIQLQSFEANKLYWSSNGDG